MIHQGFSKLAYLTTSLQKKRVKFVWSQNCQESFDIHEHLLTLAPILKIAYPYKDFIVCMNASKEGLKEGVITGRDVICYESRKLKEHEKNYTTHELDLASIIHALKMWHHYMIGKRFMLMTNNIGLKYLFDQ